jgi:transposase
MLGDSAAAVSAMTAAWGCLFAALAGFRKKASSCEGARPPSPGWAFAISNQRCARRPSVLQRYVPPNVSAELQRDMARLGFVMGQIRDIEDARRKRLEQQPETGPHAMVRLLNRVVGVGIETADMLVHEVLSRPMRDRKAMARYAGLTGSPDESGAQRR